MNILGAGQRPSRVPCSKLSFGILALLASMLFKTTISHAQETADMNPDLESNAERAYVYAYPLVLIDATRNGQSVNQLTQVPRFPSPSTRRVIRPNADTLYTLAWLDLSNEPMLIHVPDSGGRFYLLQFMDAWTETFANPGKRTTGTSETWFALVGPGWTGRLPPDVTRYDAPTNIVWLLGRTQTNGVLDYDRVHAFQKGMHLMPLSGYPNGETDLGSPTVFGSTGGMTPVDRVRAMSGTDFFAAFASALKENPMHEADTEMLTVLGSIGIVPGRGFNPKTLSDDQLRAIDDGAREASAGLERFANETSAHRVGWNSFSATIGRYGTDYLARATTARIALGANPPEDAVYTSTSTDSAGKPLIGSARYRMHFDRTELPPVNAFWSITAYDRDGYFIANPINRYAIGDRDALEFNPDGSLDLQIQSERPSAEHEANWLPSGSGDFNLTVRLYWPGPAVLKGLWKPPEIERVP